MFYFPRSFYSSLIEIPNIMPRYRYLHMNKTEQNLIMLFIKFIC